ncbi:hypothetical protein Nepgr_022595 [Nepenthes gracilis]|uniref:Uncharacterized protein n=1 Tax=Nepenthes gracilis TaxID=150966 RepID=A0AAD3T0L3_NEPGR|nr:hypothetical protein Nepgr_022595 [Nepenthes gracilis]
MSGSFQSKQASYSLQEGVWDSKNESHSHFPGMDKLLISPPFITSSEPSNHQRFLSDMNKMLNSCLESAGHGMVMFDGSSSVLEDGWRETQQGSQATKNVHHSLRPFTIHNTPNVDSVNLSRQQVVVNGGLKARTSWDNMLKKTGWYAVSGGGYDEFTGGTQLGAAQGVPNGREFGGVRLVSFPVVRKTVEFVTLEKRNLGGGRQQVQQQEFSEAFRRHFNEVQARQNG